MSESEEWLALIHVDQLGAVTFHKLLDRFGSPGAILRAGRNELQMPGISKQVVDGILSPDETAVRRDLEWLQHDSHHLITIQDADYPELLKNIADPPVVLYALGETSTPAQLLSAPQLAIVGSRNASAQGRETAQSFAQHLAQAGMAITSGLASGIDGAAHRGALQAQIGTTTAVAACGLDQVYPASHQKLAEEIAQRGMIVSEFPIGTSPRPGHFPRRNRIISGLSLGVLVVEASMKSGSLITARLAIEQNREVFALPGSIHNPLSKGCHALIRDGAKLVETVADILQELKDHINLDEAQMDATPSDSAASPSAQDPEHEKVLNSMGHEPVSIDSLVGRSGMDASAISSILLILELNGQVSHNGNGVYVRTHQI